MAQTADLIFSGTVSSVKGVTSGTAVFTEVSFENVDRIKSSSEARQTATDEVKLLFAGGQVNGGFLRVGGTPAVEQGKKYLLFMLDDGRPYINPVVGGSQGIFQVVADPKSGKDIFVNASGKGITGVDSEGKLKLTATPVAGEPSGKTTAESDRFQPVQATSSEGPVAPAVRPRQEEASVSPISLDQFAVIFATML